MHFIKLILLNAGAAWVVLAFPLAFILFLVVWGLIEGFFIYRFKINKFGRSVWHAVLVNLVSFVMGFVIINMLKQSGYPEYTEVSPEADSFPAWSLFWLVSVIIEALLLKALNRSITWGRIFAASSVMNLVSYMIMYASVYYAY